MTKKTILLAEPNELLRIVLTERLKMDDFNVSSVENGLQLIKTVETNQPDLIITEELLPFRSGLEVIAMAKVKGIPVIIISDADLEEKILEAFRLGAADFIDKPFSPNEVVARARNVLNKINSK